MTENTPTMSRRDALTSVASATTVLLAGCSTLNSDDPTDTDEPRNESTPGIMTTTPRTTGNDSGEFASNETTSTGTPPDTTTPTSTPNTTETPESTPTSTPGNQDSCGLEYSEDVMSQARQVGLEARDAVVWLYHNNVGKEEIMGGIGTGWFIDDTHIVTNGHIVDHNNQEDGSFRAITINNESYELEVVDYIYKEYPTRDIGLLRLKNGTAPHTLTPGDSSTLTETQPVIQIGHPITIGTWLIALGEHTGRTSESEGRSLTAEIPSAAGNSGSPQITLDGTVVGMHWGTSTSYPGRAPGEAPQPIDEDVETAPVYTELPYQKRQTQMAEPIEEIQARITEWRS